MRDFSSKEPILILTHEFYPKRGGIAVYTEETARAAVNRGWDVEVWAPDPAKSKQRNQKIYDNTKTGSRVEAFDRSFPFRVRTLPIKGTMNWSCRRKTIQALGQADQRLLKATTIYLPEPGPILAFMYTKLIGFPKCRRLVLTLHGSEILLFTRYPHRKILFRRLLKKSDKIGVVSNFNKTLLLERYPDIGLETKIEIVPGALRSDFEAIPLETNSKSNKEKLVILTTARIHPRKGQHCVIEALGALAKDEKAKVQYQVTGANIRPKYLEHLKTLARELEVDLNYLGEIPDQQLPKIYQNADIFAMTSEPLKTSIEGFGLVYLEAARHGLPVIAHYTGGVAEAVLDGKTGLLVAPDDRKGLTRAIEKLIRTPSLRERLGLNGSKRIESLSWNENVRKLFEN